jgi:hypothetical protein
MPWILSSMVIASLLVAFSYKRLLAVRELRRWATPHLAGPRRGLERPSQLGSRAAGDAQARVAELNEATLELGFGLRDAGVLPRVCAKAALSMGAVMALMQGAQLLDGGDTRAWSGPLLSFAGGCAGALGCTLIGRSAELEARRLRDDWRTLIRQSTEDVSDVVPGDG